MKVRHRPGIGQGYFLARPCRRSGFTFLHSHQIADISEHSFQVGHVASTLRAGCLPTMKLMDESFATYFCCFCSSSTATKNVDKASLRCDNRLRPRIFK